VENVDDFWSFFVLAVVAELLVIAALLAWFPAGTGSDGGRGLHARSPSCGAGLWGARERAADWHTFVTGAWPTRADFGGTLAREQGAGRDP
jgi:hypothetical protein